MKKDSGFIEGIVYTLLGNILLSNNHDEDFTCRFDGFPTDCDLHRRADQDPYGVVLWVQQLVLGFKRKTK